jgi:two-component system nitrogen regulation sensor histidine kinase GlnL
VGLNAAFARWLGISVRRLIGLPLAALELDGNAMARFLDNSGRDVLRLHRMALGCPARRRVLPTAGCRASRAAGCWRRIRSMPMPAYPAKPCPMRWPRP